MEAADRHTELIKWVRQYREQGFSPIPLLPRTKHPIAEDWPNRRFKDQEFSASANVGVLTGVPVGGTGHCLVDLDLDDSATASLAPLVLPPTASFGRPGRPTSHLLYLVDQPIVRKVFENGSKKFVDMRGLNPPQDGAAGSPCQTMFPPSVHPTGELLRWNTPLEPARIAARELRRLAGWLATIRLLQDYWVVQSRHEMALALAGWLAVCGWFEEEVVKLVRLISETAGDREGRDRETAIAATFAKLRANNRKFRQKKRLIELLGDAGKRVAALIEDWLALRPLPVSVEGMPLLEGIEALRHEGGQAGDRHRRIAELVLRALRATEQGFLGRGEDDLQFYFSRPNHRLIDLGDAQFEYFLASVTGLNPTEREFRFVLEAVRTQANGLTPKRLGVFGAYDPATRHLEVGNGSSRIWVHDPNGQWRSMDNGDGLTLFATVPGAEPWEPQFGDESKGALTDFLAQIWFEERCGLTPVDQHWLMRVYVLWMFFPRHQHDKPIPNMIGEYGSGKSTAERRLGQLLIGPRFENTVLPRDQKDFESLLCGRSLAVIDNADEPSTYLEGSLATYATGADIGRREYYTTNTNATFKTRAFLLVNSIDPRFRRQDVADRMIPMHCVRPQCFKSQSKLADELSSKRGLILADLLNELGRIADQAFGGPAAPDLPLRLADFGEFGWLVARLDNREEQWTELLVRLKDAQAGFAVENDTRFATLVEWAQRIPDGVGGKLELFPCDLFDQGANVAEVGGTNWFPNAQAMSQWLRNSRPTIERVLKSKLEFSEPGHGNRRKLAFTRLEARVVEVVSVLQ